MGEKEKSEEEELMLSYARKEHRMRALPYHFRNGAINLAEVEDEVPENDC